MSDKFDDAIHSIGDWCADHKTATVAVACLAFGLVFGVLLAI